MGVFTRMIDMTKASVHEMLDKMEDPVVMMNQYIRDMEREIAEAEVSVAKHIANERRLRDRLSQAEANSAAFEAKAVQELEAGNEEQAKLWLAEKLASDNSKAELSEMAANAAVQASNLTRQLQGMKEEFSRLQSKRGELEYRAQVAKARKQVSQLNSGGYLESGQAVRGFRRIEDRIARMEVEAELARGGYAQTARSAGLGNDPIEILSKEQLQAEIQLLKARLEPMIAGAGDHAAQTEKDAVEPAL